MRKKEAWTDADEKRFIDGLGTHAPESRQKRKNLLLSYRDALSERNLCGFDKKKAMANIDKSLFEMAKNLHN